MLTAEGLVMMHQLHALGLPKPMAAAAVGISQATAGRLFAGHLPKRLDTP